MMTAVSLVWCADCAAPSVLNLYDNGPDDRGLLGAYCLEHAPDAVTRWPLPVAVGFFDHAGCDYGTGYVDGESCRACAGRLEGAS